MDNLVDNLTKLWPFFSTKNTGISSEGTLVSWRGEAYLALLIKQPEGFIPVLAQQL